MKNTITFLWLFAWLASPVILAQTPAKRYVAELKGPIDPNKRRNDEITFQAKSQIKQLEELLNTISTDLTETELNSVISNSFQPNPNQLFYNDGVIIEDDIDPKHTSADNTSELVVERYLRNLNLFFTKSDTASIVFSQVITASVVDGKDYPYIKVFLKSTFKGRHSQFDSAYQPTQRVAELRAEKVDGKWRTFITHLGFLRPNEVLNPTALVGIAPEFGPAKPLTTPLVSFRKVDNAADSINVKWNSQWLTIVKSSMGTVPIGSYQRSNSGDSRPNTVSVSLSPTNQQLSFRYLDGSVINFTQPIINKLAPGEAAKLIHRYQVRGWIQVVAGVLALGGSYAGYTSLQSSYKQYTSQLTALNTEYAVWQTLTQQPAGSQAVPASFGSYATPGIYAVYGGGVTGVGLLFNGLRQLLKAGNLKSKRSK